MSIHSINQEILQHVESFQSLTELEDYLNSEKFKNIAIELQIENFQRNYPNKIAKQYIKNLQEQILLIHQNVHFSIEKFTLSDKKPHHLSYDMPSSEEESQKQFIYRGRIHIKLNEPLNYNIFSSTSLFQNSIFNTGGGGGGNISQYEFYFLEKHLPNLSHQFLFDFKADNSLLNYRANSLYFKPTTFIPVLLLQNHLNDVDNKQKLLNNLEHIFDTHFQQSHEMNIKSVNLFFNIISTQVSFINSFEPKFNEKYVTYLKNALAFMSKKENLEDILQFNLTNNEAVKYENSKNIKEAVKNNINLAQIALMKFSTPEDKITIYETILASNPKDNIYNNLHRNDATKDKDFLNYCFDSKDPIPKFFIHGNIEENIYYYFSASLPISKEQKIKNEAILLNILKEQHNDRATQSLMFNYFYSPDNAENSFNVDNKELINFFMHQYILIQSNKPIDQIITNHNFSKLCKYLDSLDSLNLNENSSDISVPFLFLLTHHKIHCQTAIKNNQNVELHTQSLELFDKLIIKTNQFLEEQNIQQPIKNNKKIKI